jgi:hypothetical protein
VSAIGGLCGTPDCGAAYDETSGANRTDKRIQSPNINTTGYGGLTLSFNYIAAQGDDDVTVVYSCNGGTTWNTLPALGATSCCDCNDAFFCSLFGICCGGITACNGTGQGYWTTQNYALPVCAENIANLKIGFHWFNNGNGLGTDPSVAIDDITITSSVPLAATLVSFSGKVHEDRIHLNWSTASEKDNQYFSVERRSAEGEFVSIGRVEGAGNSNTYLSYYLEDSDPLEGDNYYRLSLIDINGSITYSDVIYVPYFSHFTINSMYPNPAKDQLNFVIMAHLDQAATISICDIQGRIIHSENQYFHDGKNLITIPVSHLEPGRYTCLIESGGKRLQKQLILE